MPWLSAYLFTPPPWEPFLVESLAPFLRSELASGRVQKFFFIRYFENGPHLRIRLQTEPRDEPDVRDALEAVAAGYFASGRAADSAYSMPWIAYEPEYDRYGGLAGIEIAERHFFSSSAAVLECLGEGAGETPGSRFTAGLHFATGLLAALGFEPARTGKVLEDDFHHWLVAKGEWQNDEQGREMLAAFEKSFEASEAALTAVIEKLWAAVRGGTELADDWFARWVEETKGIRGDLTAAIETRRLVFPAGPCEGIPHPLALSYLHMTLNRLGILGRQETLLNYFLLRALSRIGGE